MSKRKSSIKKFQLKDEKSFKTLSNCGHATKDQLLSIKGMSEKRIDNYVKDGLIKKDINFNKKTNSNIEAYRLTDYGRNFINKNFNINHNYVPQSIEHDLAITNKYLSLTEKEQDSFKNETVLKNEFYQTIEQYRDEPYKTQNGELLYYNDLWERYHNGSFSSVDCCYTSESGQIITYEVETDSYREQHIVAKIEFCNFMKMEYNSINIDEK